VTIRRRIKIILVILSFLLLHTEGFASSQTNNTVSVKTSVDKQTITIGDKINYTIIVESPKDIEIQLPKFADNLGNFAIRDFGSSQKLWWNKKVYKQWYILDTYTSGSYTIPEAAIKYRKTGEKEWHTLNTKKIKIEVKSLLDKNNKPSDIRDIAPPLYLPSWTFLYLAALALLGVVFVIIWLNLRRKKKTKEQEKPKRPAHEIAYEALALLEKKDYISRGEIEAYYVELSDIVRHYIENRFDIRAPEMTTEEFLEFVKNDKKLTTEQKSLLRDFLSHCDLVKFAKYHPDAKEVRLSFDSAKKLIDETKEENTQNIIQK